jgi:hypothetical protein
MLTLISQFEFSLDSLFKKKNSKDRIVQISLYIIFFSFIFLTLFISEAYGQPLGCVIYNCFHALSRVLKMNNSLSLVFF